MILQKQDFDLEQECSLDDSIQFNPVATFSTSFSEILLTGATGFLGGYLLYELLQKTRARIYCLIRADDVGAGMKRLREHLENYELWEDAFEERIVPIPGDLAAPLFGLSDEDYTHLSQTIQAIYHNGAYVNFFYTYARLKQVNVAGTRAIIKFAGEHHTKPVHFISSMSVFFNQHYLEKGLIADDDQPNDIQTLKGGYKRTKWVSEKLLLAAAERGLPVSMYRPARITPDSESGLTFHWNDAFNQILRACVIMGAYPAADTTLQLVPVDYVARAAVYLSQQPASAGRGFNLVNHPVHWDQVFESVRRFGYPVEAIPKADWLERLQKDESGTIGRESVAILVRFFRSSNSLFMDKPDFEDSITRKSLAEGGITCPEGLGLLDTYIAYFSKCGFFPPVSAA